MKSQIEALACFYMRLPADAGPKIDIVSGNEAAGYGWPQQGCKAAGVVCAVRGVWKMYCACWHFRYVSGDRSRKKNKKPLTGDGGEEGSNYVQGRMEEIWSKNIDRSLLHIAAGRSGDCGAEVAGGNGCA